MKKDIMQLLNKYQELIKRIENNMDEFPEEKQTLTTRKNVYKDMVLDLENILDLHKEEI